jgi:hypothetical protein
MSSPKSGAQAKFPCKYASSDNPGQLSSIIARVGWVSAANTEKVEH